MKASEITEPGRYTATHRTYGASFDVQVTIAWSFNKRLVIQSEVGFSEIALDSVCGDIEFERVVG